MQTRGRAAGSATTDVGVSQQLGSAGRVVVATLVRQTTRAVSGTGGAGQQLGSTGRVVVATLVRGMTCAVNRTSGAGQQFGSTGRPVVATPLGETTCAVNGTSGAASAPRTGLAQREYMIYVPVAFCC